LTSDIIIDHNIIEELVDTNTSNESYENDVFLIQYSKSIVNPRATQGFYLNGGVLAPALYNEILNNSNTALRNRVQGNIANYLGTGDDTFEAKNTNIVNYQVLFIGTQTDTISPYPFQSEIADPNNNYNNTTYRYST